MAATSAKWIAPAGELFFFSFSIISEKIIPFTLCTSEFRSGRLIKPCATGYMADQCLHLSSNAPKSMKWAFDERRKKLLFLPDETTLAST